MALNEEDQTEVAFKSVRADVDPVSGNEVPPGSLPEEVRDDIPVMLSEGEYVVPADVLRYYGVKFFEDLRTMAKVGLADMEANGRIGGEPIEEQGELPFTDDELLAEEDAMEPEDEQMSAAFGGLVGFAPGGLNMPEGTQVGTTGSAGFAQDPNDPTQVVMGSALSSTGYELVTFYGPGGINDKVNIPFFNGMALAAIPPNYTKDAPQETELEKSTSDSRDPVDPTLMEKVLSKQEKDKPIDYKNPESVLQAIDTYYSSGPMFKAFGPVGFAADIGISKYEKSNLLSNIDETLNDNEFTSANPEAAKTIAGHKQLLTDKDAYQAQSTEERGFGDWLKGLFGFGDGSFSLKNDPIPPKPDFDKDGNPISNKDWSDTTLGNWVDATNLVQSLHPSDDPVAYHKAIKAQSDASRAATAAAQAAAAEKDKDEEE
tara:strand:+ start:740 stop:2029 length:1290 start_codon:yes stop_codon:yes gene_type:complete